MEGVIHVARDAEGLQLAIRELFEESFFEESNKQVLALIGDDDDERGHVMEDSPQRTLADGYYVRASYVLSLGASIDAGVKHGPGDLRPEDVAGLQALRRAKHDFERDHPACSACGTRQLNSFMVECRKCRAKFAGRAA